MKNKNEKGFALVLSLVLLMAMSLMGGALIVISASDHQSNNVSDEFQQTFYVAETALLEGEKYLINQFLGPYKKNGKGERDTENYGLTRIQNTDKVTNPPHKDVEKCYNSFSDIDRLTFKPVSGAPVDEPDSATKSVVYADVNYRTFITDNVIDDAKERTRLSKFKFQYFFTQIGEAEFEGKGQSAKKAATDKGKSGMAYRIYGCGIFDDGKIIVPLESTLVFPNN
jgi:hypothetical protein